MSQTLETHIDMGSSLSKQCAVLMGLVTSHPIRTRFKAPSRTGLWSIRWWRTCHLQNSSSRASQQRRHRKSRKSSASTKRSEHNGLRSISRIFSILAQFKRLGQTRAAGSSRQPSSSPPKKHQLKKCKIWKRLHTVSCLMKSVRSLFHTREYGCDHGRL